jgi:hypothetical protein
VECSCPRGPYRNRETYLFFPVFCSDKNSSNHAYRRLSRTKFIYPLLYGMLHELMSRRQFKFLFFSCRTIGFLLSKICLSFQNVAWLRFWTSMKVQMQMRLFENKSCCHCHNKRSQFSQYYLLTFWGHRTLFNLRIVCELISLNPWKDQPWYKKMNILRSEPWSSLREFFYNFHKI